MSQLKLTSLIGYSVLPHYEASTQRHDFFGTSCTSYIMLHILPLPTSLRGFFFTMASVWWSSAMPPPPSTCCCRTGVGWCTRNLGWLALSGRGKKKTKRCFNRFPGEIWGDSSVPRWGKEEEEQEEVGDIVKKKFLLPFCWRYLLLLLSLLSLLLFLFFLSLFFLLIDSPPPPPQKSVKGPLTGRGKRERKETRDQKWRRKENEKSQKPFLYWGEKKGDERERNAFSSLSLSHQGRLMT